MTSIFSIRWNLLIKREELARRLNFRNFTIAYYLLNDIDESIEVFTWMEIMRLLQCDFILLYVSGFGIGKGRKNRIQISMNHESLIYCLANIGAAYAVC